MKRLMIIVVVALATAGCTSLQSLRDSDDAYADPFYAKYLNTGSNLDAQIKRTLEALRQNPDAAELHNTLGALLVEKGFPNDAEREFERAVDTNRKYFPAWYNLGLVRAAHHDGLGARRAFRRTIDLKPGHAQALFQLGLIEEKNHHTDRAVRLYAKAYAINPALMRVDFNPRILDSRLTHMALLEMYPRAHSRRSMQFQGIATFTPVVASTQPVAAPQPTPPSPTGPTTATAISTTEQSPVHPPGKTSKRGRQRRPTAEATQPTPEATPVKPPNQ